ncbi:hypothetical protein EHV10_07600 [Lachnoanaerobaculum gingivalis]|uniref:Uncharacterized protein n=1 Tax=Lachnoanaerobaculum gingivalis TaxID=2490855 RepID=A0A3P3QW95_9FIRM|nr:DUF6361 family protein [Lachnoanaerobaculum gingivalis]RRJ25491.1 hypothetical protein EHV10_07600 [Lachnoanaerobaculum gingivalis]
MPIGWIDFSKKERNKVISVLDLLSENSTLDELGIATIRDGFSDLFFPGTSTVQTRAKYFFIVPYALRDLERSGETDANDFLEILNAIERECAERFIENNPGETGVIGSRSLASGHWVKRTPADIYWSGLRQYNIFHGGRLSLSEYVRAVCEINAKKRNLIELGNRNDKAEENDTDDADAGDIRSMHFWNIPTYDDEWFDKLKIELTKEEAKFLKERIINSCGESIFAHALKNNLWEIMECDSFENLKDMIRLFPKQIQKDYRLAKDFSEFNYVLRIIYNIVLSDEKNEEANEAFDNYRSEMKNIANIDLEAVFACTDAWKNPMMCKFLLAAKSEMLDENISGLKKIVENREVFLKGSGRARCAHPGEFDNTEWFGGYKLNYRFDNAIKIMNDIYTGGGEC